MNNLYNLLKTIIEKLNATKDTVNNLPQPDWNQNDDTQPDYVKNRPFYTGDPVETVLVEERTVAFADTGYGFYGAEVASTFEATVGETYKVSWDGTEYECACVDFDGYPAIGNLSIAGVGSDTGEPFTIGIFNGERIQIIAADTSASHTFSISAKVAPVVKIDPKYIRDMYYTSDPVETVLVEERTVAFADTGYGFYGAEVASTFEATVGETYKVSWDGTEYECACVDFDGYPAIGNLSIAGVGSDTGEPFIIGIFNGERIQIITADTSASHTISISATAVPVIKIDRKYLPAPFRPEGTSYLMFSSPNSFILEADGKTKGWDSTLEYFSSDRTWATWDGSSTLSAVYDYGEYVLYLRGTGNTVITNDLSWVLNGTNIKCIGNIENLLDYSTVESGEHPPMADKCYSYMFKDCTSLTQAPALPATTLANHCYRGMFQGCTSLTQSPALPATTLADSCYQDMFNGCTNLTQAPALHATTLADSCYQDMFNGCTNLTQAPALHATTLADECYRGMFQGCTNLTQAPDLPATTLANYCYQDMFNGCTSLTQSPALPATTLADSCYMTMFKDCTSLTQAPDLPATTLANHCYQAMFYSCTSLKLSSTKTDEYTQEYRIHSSGEGTTAINALSNMFYSTGGTFKGTPSINTTYYLSSDNMIVRETDIATLNGYVGSMIDNAVPTVPTNVSAFTNDVGYLTLATLPKYEGVVE